MKASEIRVGQRPQSLLEVVNLVNAGQSDFGEALAEFLDEAKKMDATCLAASLAKAPGWLRDDNPHDANWQDAYLAATAEHLSRAAGIAIPAWTEQGDRFLSRAWFDNQGLQSLNAMMLAQSPLAFRRRFIFTEAHPFAASLNRI